MQSSVSGKREVAPTEGSLSETITWKLENGALTISGTGDMPKLSYGNTPWAAYIGKITSLVIEEGVTSIGRTAFYGAAKLTSVSLPATLEKIEGYAFYNCTALESITIPSNVTEIGAFAFRKCRALKDMTFETAYGWSADGMSFTKSEMVSKADDYLVTGNYMNTWTRDVNAEDEEQDPNLVDFGICGENVKWTLVKLENGKMKLTISGEGEMENYYSSIGAPWTVYKDSIVEAEIGEGVTNIGKCAFYSLNRLEKVTLPNTVINIGDYAFNTCWKLKEIAIPESVTVIGKDAFKKTGLSVIPTV